MVDMGRTNNIRWHPLCVALAYCVVCVRVRWTYCDFACTCVSPNSVKDSAYVLHTMLLGSTAPPFRALSLFLSLSTRSVQHTCDGITDVCCTRTPVAVHRRSIHTIFRIFRWFDCCLCRCRRRTCASLCLCTVGYVSWIFCATGILSAWFKSSLVL